MKNRDILNKDAEKKLGKETETVKVQFDGRQFVIKIPTEFTRTLELKKGDQMKLSLEIPQTGSTRKAKIQAELVD